jgi:tetratricopeptide (TPR) repeat protein
MPRTGSTLNHTSITDHRIVRQVKAEQGRTADGAWVGRDEIPLVLFHANLVDKADEEVQRGLGIALMDLADNQPNVAARRLGQWALPLLEAALAVEPNDPAAWDARGDALWFQGRKEEAQVAYDSALERAPDREITLARAAALAGAMKRPVEARAYWERALRVNPWRWQYHFDLARVQAQGEDWQGALAECQQALLMYPAHLGTRQLLILCCLRRGDRTRAEKELAVLVGLTPEDKREPLRRWFAAQERLPGASRSP